MTTRGIGHTDIDESETELCDKNRYNVRDYLAEGAQILQPNQECQIGRHLGHGKIYKAFLIIAPDLTPRANSHPELARVVLQWDEVCYDYTMAELDDIGRINSSERQWWLSKDDVHNGRYIANWTPSLPITYYKQFRFYVRNPPTVAGQEIGSFTVERAECYRIVLADARVKGISQMGGQGIKVV